MKTELEPKDVEAIAEKVMTMNDRVTGWAHFQAQALYSLDRQGLSRAHWIRNPMRGTV